MFNFLLTDQNGTLWHYQEVYHDSSIIKSRFALPCVTLCSHNLKRVHLTCFRCGLRRTHGEPPPHPVMMHVDYIPRDLPKWKIVVVKLLHSITEVFQEP